jgi:hypothetical protein
MRYFFNVISDGVEIPDPEGSDLPGEDAAQEEAHAIRAELAKHYRDRLERGFVLEVKTECGRRILALPVRHALEEMASCLAGS